MNAAAALYVSGAAKDYRSGVDIAKEALARGKAREKLEKLRECQGKGRPRPAIPFV